MHVPPIGCLSVVFLHSSLCSLFEKIENLVTKKRSKSVTNLMETTQTSTDTVTNSQPSGAEPQTTVTTTDQEPTEPIVINSSTNSNSNSIPNSNPLFQEFIQPDEERVAEIDAHTALETMKDLADELFTEDEEKDVIETIISITMKLVKHSLQNNQNHL